MRTRAGVLSLLCLFGLVAAMRDSYSRDRRPERSIIPHLKHYEVVSVDSSHFRVQTHTYSGQSIGSRTSAGAWTQAKTHPGTSQFRMTAFGRDFNVLLSKNTDLFAPDYFEEDQHWENGVLNKDKTVRTYGLPPHRDCHYRGFVENTEISESLVALSTCSGGFEGLLNAFGDSYSIAPAASHLSPMEIDARLATMGHESDSGSRLSLHVMYRNADLQVWESLAGGSFCAVTPAEEALADSQIRQRRAAALETQSTAEALRRWMSVVPRPENAERLRREVLQQSATTKPKPQAGPTTKYVELLVVNDWKRIMQRGGNTLDGSNAIVNVQNALYSTVTWSTGLYKVQLIGQISFVNGDPYKVANGTCQDCTAFEVDVNELLSKFNVYRSNPDNTPAHDCGHLFSGFDFQTVALGYAGVGVMCRTSQSGGIDQVTFDSPSFNAAISAHEMGHNFGMQHDSVNNACPESGFIMNAKVDLGNAPTQFSSCSVTYLDTYMSDDTVTCLNNVPTRKWGAAECGNGFVETGEQCDCGKRDCSTTLNTCCNGTSCQFLKGAQCSNTEACCSNCKIINDTSLVCRASVGVCDIAETCTGQTGACPPDEFKGVGTACEEDIYGPGACYLGVCESHMRECREVGSKFQGAPYDACPVATQTYLNNDNYCGTMWCTNDPGSCTTFRLNSQAQVMNDGIPCDDGKQCKSGQCVFSSALSTQFQWAPSEYSPCSSCDQMQTRTLGCRRIATQQDVDPVYCTPSAKPLSSRKCENETLACVHENEDLSSSEIDLFGYHMQKNTLMFGSLGAASLFLVALACCYQAVTWGADEHEILPQSAPGGKSAGVDAGGH